MLQAENFQALTARLCMCELHLKFKGRMIELETVVARIAAWALPATDGLLITGQHLPHVLKVAVTFLTHKFKTHLIQSDDGEEGDHVGCATHCTTYMLSVAANGDANPPGDGPFCSSCAHEHGMTCDECNLAFQVLDECKQHVQMRRNDDAVRDLAMQDQIQACGMLRRCDMHSC